MGPCWASLRSTPSRHGRWQRTRPSGPRCRSSSPPLLHSPPKSQPLIKPRRLRPDYRSLNSLSVRPSRVGSGGGDACEARSCCLFPLAAAGDHTTETNSPWNKSGDEEGRRGWRWPGSRPAAILGSASPRGHPAPRPAAPCRIADPWAGDGAAAAGAGVGDRRGGVRGGFWSGPWSSDAGLSRL